jgi:hypothetical protein
LSHRHPRLSLRPQLNRLQNCQPKQSLRLAPHFSLRPGFAKSYTRKINHLGWVSFKCKSTEPDNKTLVFIEVSQRLMENLGFKYETFGY